MEGKDHIFHEIFDSAYKLWKGAHTSVLYSCLYVFQRKMMTICVSESESYHDHLVTSSLTLACISIPSSI